MLYDRLLSILAALFALAILWQILSLIKPDLYDANTPKISIEKKALKNADIKGSVEEGKKIADLLCAGCHNRDGNSLIYINPILAGQHAEYITKQLNDFKIGSDNFSKRNSPIMATMITSLSFDDIINLGAYYSAQIPAPRAAKNKELAELGEKVYRGGNIESGVPACASCHSPNGAGIPPFYPRLAGQYAEYTVVQLRAFRTEQRANDVNRIMRDIVARMSEKEIKAVAEFISGLQ